MKKEIPWELIISDLKQDISDADKKHLEQIVIRLRKGLKDIFFRLSKLYWKQTCSKLADRM